MTKIIAGMSMSLGLSVNFKPLFLSYRNLLLVITLQNHARNKTSLNDARENDHDDGYVFLCNPEAYRQRVM